MKLISIVISAYNEEDNIKELYRQLTSELATITSIKYEIIFVNDGSKDDTLNACLALISKDTCVKLVNLTRNFGHEIAMTAGMDYSSGDAVLFMDADLQHPPVYARQMIEMWLTNDLDIITTKRKYKKETLKRKVTNWIFYKVCNLLSDIKLEHNSPDFRLIDRKYINRLKQMIQKERMFRSLINFIGFSKSAQIEFVAPERLFGTSKYTFFSLVSLALDGIFQFSTRPLRLITFLGVFFTIISVIFAGYSVFEYFYYNMPALGFTTLVTLMSLFFAFQTIFISILGEYIGRIHLEVKNRPLYFADFITQNKDEIDTK